MSGERAGIVQQIRANAELILGNNLPPEPKGLLEKLGQAIGGSRFSTHFNLDPQEAALAPCQYSEASGKSTVYVNSSNRDVSRAQVEFTVAGEIDFFRIEPGGEFYVWEFHYPLGEKRPASDEDIAKFLKLSNLIRQPYLTTPENNPEQVHG